MVKLFSELKTAIPSQPALLKILHMAVNSLSLHHNYISAAHMQINAFINSDASRLWGTDQMYSFHRIFARPLKQFYLLNQPVSIDFKSRTLIVEILFQGCAVVHFQEQSISFTVFGQRAGFYIKNRQTGWEKIDGILFPAGRERERGGGGSERGVRDGGSMEYSMSSVSYSFGKHFRCRGHYLVLWSG